MTDNTKVWLHGLGAAFIGAVGSSLSTILVAPDRFNLNSVAGAKNVVLASLTSGIIAAALYLSKSPVPALQQTVNKKSLTDGTTTLTSETVTTTPVDTSKP